MGGMDQQWWAEVGQRLEDEERMSNAAKRHMSRVAEQGCALCRVIGFDESPAEIHHLRTGAGAGRRASDWLVIPLCPDHHRGTHGIHGDRAAFRNAGVDELDLLANTIALAMGRR